MTEIRAYDMSEHQRLINVDASDEHHEIRGTFWVSVHTFSGGVDRSTAVPVDVMIWCRERGAGIVFGADDLHAGGKSLTILTRDKRACALAEDAGGLLTAVCAEAQRVGVEAIRGGAA